MKVAIPAPCRRVPVTGVSVRRVHLNCSCVPTSGGTAYYLVQMAGSYPSAPQPRPPSVTLLVALLAVLGLSGFVGGIALLADTSGAVLDLSPTLLDGSPFADYLIPGLALFVFLGVFPLLVAGALVTQHRLAWQGVLAAGLAVLVWFTVQLVVVGWGNALQWLYLLLGVAILVVGVLPSVRRYAMPRPTGLP